MSYKSRNRGGGVGSYQRRISNAAVPVNTIAPALDDASPAVGQVLAASEGTWTNTPTSFAWLWYQDAVSLGVTTETYTVQADDIGHTIKRRSIASNASGASAPVFSNISATILSNATTFTVDGTPQVNNDTINLPADTGSVEILATNGGSISAVTGIPGLVTGDNECTFTVTAEDGVTALDVTINLHVLTGGIAEVTSVTCGADTAGSLHNRRFSIWRDAGRVDIVLDAGIAAKEVTSIDCSTADAVAIYTGTSECVLIIDGNGANDAVIWGVWISGGVIPQTQPDLSGSGVNAYLEAPVDFSTVNPLLPEDSIADIQGWIAAAIRTALMGAAGFADCTAISGAAFAVTDPAFGARMDASGVSGGMTVAVTTQGVIAATATPGVMSLFASFVADVNAVAVGNAIIAAADGNGWGVINTEGTLIFTDAVPGARTHAADVDTGFAVTVTQAGANPS